MTIDVGNEPTMGEEIADLRERSGRMADYVDKVERGLDGTDSWHVSNVLGYMIDEAERSAFIAHRMMKILHRNLADEVEAHYEQERREAAK